MASVSPLRFVLKASLLWVALSVPFVVLYLVFDPMRVLRWHDDMMPGGVVSNKGNITALQYLHNRDSIRYDSFVVGSSLSINFLIDDWLRFLPDGAAAYHFDSSAMDLEQLELSLKFLAENAGVRNLMIVWDTKWDVGPSVFPAPRRALPFVTCHRSRRLPGGRVALEPVFGMVFARLSQWLGLRIGGCEAERTHNLS